MKEHVSCPHDWNGAGLVFRIHFTDAGSLKSRPPGEGADLKASEVAPCCLPVCSFPSEGMEGHFSTALGVSKVKESAGSLGVLPVGGPGLQVVGHHPGR